MFFFTVLYDCSLFFYYDPHAFDLTFMRVEVGQCEQNVKADGYEIDAISNYSLFRPCTQPFLAYATLNIVGLMEGLMSLLFCFYIYLGAPRF